MVTENVLILSNNPSLGDLTIQQVQVAGDFEAVLLKARDMVQMGYRLLSHPLGASSRMLLSPYRSLLMAEGQLPVCEQSLAWIENSIITYRKMLQKRKVDVDNAEDYAMVDKTLLMSTIRENASN